MFKYLIKLAKNIVLNFQSLVKRLLYGVSGCIILPLAATIALPQRIYHSCKRLANKRKNQSEKKIELELENGCSLYAETANSSKITRLMIQHRTGLPIQVIDFQYMIFNLNIWGFVSCIHAFMLILSKLPCLNANQSSCKPISVTIGLYPILFTYIAPCFGFVVSLQNPKLVSINCEYINHMLKRLMGNKSNYFLQNENKRLANENLPDVINPYKQELLREFAPLCHKEKLKNSIADLVENQVKAKTLLEDIFPGPIVKIVQDYTGATPLFYMYKNSMKSRTDKNISLKLHPNRI